jgi:hypothetical protein
MPAVIVCKLSTPNNTALSAATDSFAVFLPPPLLLLLLLLPPSRCMTP